MKFDVLKLHSDSIKSKFGKNLFPSILVFLLFIFATFFINTSFAAESQPNCGIFEIKPGCDISGWLHLILGDMAIATFLGLLLHHFSRRASMKLEKIIVAQEAMRTARRDYAIQNIKNHLTTLLFIMGIINRFVASYNKETTQRSTIYATLKGEEARMGRVIQTARNTIVYSSDTLDPTLVDQLDGVCTFVSQISLSEREGAIELPKYEQSKAKIMDITKKLQDYAIAVHESKEIERRPGHIL